MAVNICEYIDSHRCRRSRCATVLSVTWNDQYHAHQTLGDRDRHCMYAPNMVLSTLWRPQQLWRHLETQRFQLLHALLTGHVATHQQQWQCSRLYLDDCSEERQQTTLNAQWFYWPNIVDRTHTERRYELLYPREWRCTPLVEQFLVASTRNKLFPPTKVICLTTKIQTVAPFHGAHACELWRYIIHMNCPW